MKMKPEHYSILETACKDVLRRYPNIDETYRLRGHSDMRLNWDVLATARIGEVRGTEWVCTLYSYLNDTHINTALARIMGNSGTNSKGKTR